MTNPPTPQQRHDQPPMINDHEPTMITITDSDRPTMIKSKITNNENPTTFLTNTRQANAPAAA
jgi:hypothetical protein